MKEITNDNLSYEEYWKEKELEYNAKLILPSYSILHNTIGEKKKPISGMLYLMTDGFHFEEFTHTSPLLALFKTFIKKKKQHTNNIKIDLKKYNILNITDRKNLTPQRKNKNVLKKILSTFLKYEYFIIIHTIESIQNQKTFLFENLVKNYVWLEKFNEIQDSSE
jgi:hypothetical protein